MGSTLESCRATLAAYEALHRTRLNGAITAYTARGWRLSSCMGDRAILIQPKTPSAVLNLRLGVDGRLIRQEKRLPLAGTARRRRWLRQRWRWLRQRWRRHRASLVTFGRLAPLGLLVFLGAALVAFVITRAFGG